MALRQQLLLGNKTASEKAKSFLFKSKVFDLSKDEWRELIAEIPEEVEEEIGILKSAGTYLHWHAQLNECECSGEAVHPQLACRE